MPRHPDYVLDASAVLALLFDESGADRIEEYLSSSVISALNFGEVLQICVDRSANVDQVATDLPNVLLEICPLTSEQARDAAMIWPIAKPHGLSLGDRVCLVLAKQLGAVAVTSDRAWQKIDIGCKVELVR